MYLATFVKIKHFALKKRFFRHCEIVTQHIFLFLYFLKEIFFDTLNYIIQHLFKY